MLVFQTDLLYTFSLPWLFTAAPQVLLRKNSLSWDSILLAFGFKPGQWKCAATRWAYIPRILRILGDSAVVARLQQMLLYVLREGGREFRMCGNVDTVMEAGMVEEEEDDEELEDESLEVIPSVKAKREQQRLDDTEELLQLLLDPTFHVKVQAGFLMTAPLRSANVKLQTETMTPSVMTAFQQAADDLADLVDDSKRTASLASCRKVLEAALLPQSVPILTAIVERAADGKYSVKHPTPPALYLRGYVGTAAVKKAAEKNEWNSLVAGANSLASTAAEAGAVMYNKWMRKLWNYAEQRNIASNYDISLATLDAIDFKVMLDQDTALPLGSETADQPWKWNPKLETTSELENAAMLDVPPNLMPTLKERLLNQGHIFTAHCRPRARALGAAPDLREFIDSDRYFYSEDGPVFDAEGLKQDQLPAWYWIRTRVFWPDLSELMLYWLCAPVSTAGLERGFSFQTAIDQDTRRRMTTYEHMRDDMMVHIHRGWFEDRIATALGPRF